MRTKHVAPGALRLGDEIALGDAFHPVVKLRRTARSLHILIDADPERTTPGGPKLARVRWPLGAAYTAQVEIAERPTEVAARRRAKLATAGQS